MTKQFDICPACSEGILTELYDEQKKKEYFVCGYCGFEFINDEQNKRNKERME